jgi:hypothetical protein
MDVDAFAMHSPRWTVEPAGTHADPRITTTLLPPASRSPAANMNEFGEQSLPAPNNEASLPVSGQMQYNFDNRVFYSPTPKGFVIQLHDQHGKSELQEPQVVAVRLHNLSAVDILQDNRRRLDKLTIATSVCGPESSSSCAQSPCESVFPPFSALMHDPDVSATCLDFS